MKLLSKRQMDKRRSTNMTTRKSTAAAVLLPRFLFFLLFSINIYLTSATTIKGPPTADRKQLKRIVRVGDHLKLPCPMTGSQPISFDWTKDSEQIKTYAWPRFKTQKRNLKIRPVQIEDTGIYTCKGTNGFGSEEIRIDLIVIDPNDFPELGKDQIPDVAAPVLTQETMSYRSAWRKNTGENFQLTCEALGKPEPEIMWYKDGVKMSNNGYNIGSSGSSGKAMLTIENLRPSNAGLYTCRAENIKGRKTRNFTLDVIPSKDDSLTNEDIPGSMKYDTIHDLANLNEGGLKMPSGPENTTVFEGDRAVLECRVHSVKKSNIMWLKRIEKEEEEREVKSANIIEVGQEKFKIIQKKKQYEDEVKVNSRGVEILNTMEISESSLQDSGMYICFVKNPSGFKFKSAYLTVIPKPVNSNSDDGANEAAESRSVVILVGCLAVVVMVLLVTIITCFLKKRQKKAANSSNTSSSSGSENSPELTENLMRQQHHQQSHPNFNPNQQYSTNGIHQQQQQAMQRNLMQQPQTGLYQQPYHQQQQMLYSQQQQQPQQRMQHPSHTNNNHRNVMNGQMSIMVNKMADTPLPPAPAPPPPPPSLHNEWNPNSLYTGGGSGSVATDSIVDAGVPVVNMYNSNLHHHLQQQQQNQYEVPHAHTRFVPGGPSSNDKGGSIFDPGSQRHIYNPRSHY